MDNAFWTEFLPLGQAIGWTILNSLWQIAIVASICRVLLWSIPQNRPNLRYGFTLGCLILATAWAGNSFTKEWLKVNQLSIDNQSVTLPIDNSLDIKPSFYSIESQNAVTNLQSEQLGNHPILKKEGLTTLITTHFLYKKVANLGEQLKPFIPYLAIVWYLGVLVLFCLIIGGFFQLNQLKKTGVHLPDTEWLHRFDQLKKQMGITRNLQFLWSEKVVEPLTFYFFKPVVLAPIGLMTSLPQAQIEVLLLHELAHIRRYDFSVNIFQSLIEVLFFYHPAVWWMSSELRKEREHCCDDLVISIHNNPLAYAEALTCLQSPNFSLKTSLAMAATGKKGSFSQRIFRLFGKYDHQPVTLKGTFLVLLLLLTGFVTQSFKQYTTPKTANSFENVLLLDSKTNSTNSKEVGIEQPAEVPTKEITKFRENEDGTDLEKWNIERLPNLVEHKDHLVKLVTKHVHQPTGFSAHLAQLKKHFTSHHADPVYTKQKTEKKEAKLLPTFDVKTAKLKDGESVFIDWTLPENAQHIDAPKYKKWSARKIRKLYEDNLHAKKLQDKNKLATEGSFRDMGEFEPITYTITDGKNKRNITLRTYVNYHRKIIKGIGSAIARQKGKKGLKALKDLEKNIPFSGSLSPTKGLLPTIVKSTSVHTRKRTEQEELGIGIQLIEAAENVTVTIKKQDGSTVDILFNDALAIGDHHFTWRFDHLKSDTYQIDITVNGQTMSQLRTIKTKNKANKKKRQNRYSNDCRGLLKAVKSEDVAAVQELLKNNSPDCSYRGDGEPRSALVAAARKGNVEIAKLILDAGGSVEYNVHGDESPLMAAANYGHLEFVNFLIARGAKVNREISQDGTALVSALRKGHYEITKTLLENGADPLLGSAFDENPFYYASKNSDGRFLDLLIEYRGKK